jgi:hypothetical protein
MIDIFADVKPRPKLYIADVTVRFNYRPRKNSKKVEQHIVNLYQVPIVLADGKFPTKTMEDSFMKKVFRVHGKGKFEESNIRLEKLNNCKFSSELAYKFNYDIH